MRLILLSILFFITVLAQGQEVVRGLSGNPALSNAVNPLQAGPSVGVFTKYVYTINKITLPFIDDFSSNNIKVYSTDTAGKVTSVVDQYDFSIGGSYPDTVNYSLDTTWQYASDSTKIAANTSFQIIRYEAATYPAKIKDTLNAWPAYEIYGTDTVKLTKLKLTNSKNIFYLLKDDASLWTGRGAFINSNYPVSPPTIGVATFDAINANGKIYNNAGVSAYTADSLVSKPIDISALGVADSLYLSFYLESKGYGDEPESSDSLVLQFLDSTGIWHSVWNTSVEESWPVDSFFKFYVKISFSKFFHKNFQFKFFNFATIDGFGTDIGNRDQWHLDYVVLDKNRTANDTYISDAAFVYPPQTIVNGYYSVPWKHFKSAGNLMTPSSQGVIRNISAFPASANFAVQIKEESSSLYNSALTQNASIPAGLTHSFNENYGSFVYTSAENDTAVFDVQYALNTTLANNFTGNDTVVFKQELSNFYAYDDGSVEAGYGFYNAGVEFAYKLPVLQSKGDSLRGVKIYFNEVLGAANYQIPFNIRVWAYNNGKPGLLMYENSVDYPDSTNGINRFLYYPLDKPVFVKDTIFIGFKQTTNEYINIGLDFNTPNPSKMYYYSTTASSWKVSAVKGSVMLRPVMSESVVIPSEVKTEENFQAVQLFPNPASSNVFIVSNDKIQVSLMDMEGRELTNQSFSEGMNPLSLSGLSEGLYLVKIIHPEINQSEFRKLIVQW